MIDAYDIAKDLDREGKFPGHVCYGTSPLLVRGANMLRKQAKYIAELEKTLEQIREGCQNVKEEHGVDNKQLKMLTTLVIRDCNLTLKKDKKMTTWTTEDRQNASPPHIVDSGASVKTLADYIEQETREEMLRQQMQLLLEQIEILQKENAKLKRDVEGLMDGRC